VLITLFPFVLFAQQISKFQVSGNKRYISLKLINGVPKSLENIKYFSPNNKILYALIYKDKTDSIYLINRSSPFCSPEYLLTLTTKGVLNSYDTLKFKKVNSEELFASGMVKDLYDKTFNVVVYYFPEKDSASFDVKIQDNSPSHSLSEFKSKYDFHFEFGIGDEFLLMFAKEYDSRTNTYGSTNKVSLLPNLHLAAGINFLKYFKIDFKLGLILVDENYYGIDDGFFFKAELFNTRICGIAGIDFFNDIGEGHNSAESGGSFILYSFGAGYETSKNFDIYILYNIQNKKVFGYSHNTGYAPFNQTYDMVFKGLIRIGFQYSFIF